MSLGSSAISFLSGEWMLKSGRPSGGDVVVLRTLWVGALLVGSLAAIKASNGASASICMFASATCSKFLEMMRSAEGPVVFGAVYAALYARFVSQWTYMANLYNQIKEVEVSLSSGTHNSSSSQPNSMAEWKAGFIEDAVMLHMATKPTMAGIIRAWYADAAVSAALKAHTADWPRHEAWLKEHKVLT